MTIVGRHWIYIVSFLLSGCYVKSDKEIISPKQAENPWAPLTTVIFQPSEKAAFQESNEFVAAILPDNTVAIQSMSVKLSYSKKISELVGHRAYILSTPSVKDSLYFLPDTSAQSDQYSIAAAIINENGDIDIYQPDSICSETVQTLAEADRAVAECITRVADDQRSSCEESGSHTDFEECAKIGAFEFIPKLIFVEGY